MIFLLAIARCQECLNISTESVNERYYTIQEGDFYLFRCFFNNFRAVTCDGGIAMICYANSIVNISECIFIKCHTNGNGGIIFFDCYSMSKVSFSKCCTTYCTISKNKIGIFAFIKIKCSESESFCTIFALSITNCGKSIHDSNGVFVCDHGNYDACYVNFSSNQCSSVSSYSFNDNQLIRIKYHNFEENMNHDSLFSVKNSQFVRVSFINCLKNSIETIIPGIFDFQETNNTIFSQCVFIDNQGSLFSLYKSYVDVTNGTIIHQINLVHSDIFSEFQYNAQYPPCINECDSHTLTIPSFYDLCVIHPTSASQKAGSIPNWIYYIVGSLTFICIGSVLFALIKQSSERSMRFHYDLSQKIISEFG